MSVEALVGSARERARVTGTAGVDADRPLALVPITRPSVVIDVRQWSLLSRMDACLTPRDLASVTGSDLADVLLDVERLTARGLCAPVAPVPVEQAPDEQAPDEQAPDEQAPLEPGLAFVHQRAPETPPAGVTWVRFTGPPEWREALGADRSTDAASDPDLIQRLISGLRKLG